MTGATNYTAKVQLAVAGSAQTEQTTTATSVTFSGLAAGTAYYVSVHSNVNGVAQQWAGVTCSTLLAPPTGLACSATTTSIVFSWNEVTGATGYTAKVQLAVAGSAQTEQTTTGVSSTSVTFSGLAAGTAYYVSVHANVGSVAQGSAGVTCSTLLAPPDGLACSATTTSIVFSWNEVTGATGYTAKVQLAVAGSAQTEQTTTGVSSTSVTFSGLAAGTAYYVSVHANVGSVAQGSAGVTCSTLLAPPDGLACSATTTSIVFSWNEVTGATGYTAKVQLAVAGSAQTEQTTTGVSSTSVTFSGLAAGTAYYVSVHANVGSVAQGWAGVTCSTLLAPPDGLACSATTTSIVFSWNEVTGATGYTAKVQLAVAGSAQTEQTTTGVSSTSVTFSGLAAGTAYYVSVHANVGSVAQGWAGVTCSTLLAPPDGLACSATTTSIEFSWNEVTGATGYTAKVQLAVAGSAQTEQTTTGVSSTSVTFSGLAAGTAYYVSVHANVGSVAQGWAGVTCSTLLAPPDGLACSATTTSIEFSWNEVTGATGYTAKVQLAVAGSDQTEQTTTGVSSTSVTFSGLAAGTAYYVSVHANVGSVAQGWAGVTCSTLLAPPDGLACSATTTSIEFSWNEVTGATGYTAKVQLAVAGSDQTEQTTTGVSSTSVTFSGLAAGTAYYVSVHANVGSEPQGWAGVTCSTLLAPPDGLACSATTTSIEFSWNEVTGATGYTAKVQLAVAGSDQTEQTTTGVSSTSVTFSGLAAGTAYYVSVHANVGSEPQGWAGVTCSTLLAPPDGLACSATTTSIEFSWNEVTGATGYTAKVQLAVAGSDQTEQTTTGVSSTSVTFSELAAGTAYYVSVHANVDAAAQGSAGVTCSTLLAPPDGLACSATTTSIEFSWNEVTGATGYTAKVQLAVAGSDQTEQTTTGVSSTSVTFSELAAGTAYYVSVHANVDAAAQGSAGVTCSTLLAPPDGLACSATTTSIEFSWNEVTGATGYTAKVQLAVAGSDQTEQTTTGVSSTSVTFSELAAGTAYYVSVHANVDAAAQGWAGVTCSTLLAPPDGLACSATTTSIEFSWNEVTGATGYTAKVQLAVAGSDQTEQTTTGVSSTSVTFSELAAGTAYYVSVHANVGSEPQGWAGVTCSTLLAPPDGLACSATTTSIEFSWNEVTGATGYTAKVQLAVAGSDQTEQTTTGVSSTSVTFSELAAGTAYYVSVHANVDAAAQGSAGVTCSTLLAPPDGLACSATTTSIEFSWNEVTGATGYTAKVQLAVAGSDQTEQTTTGVSSTSVTFSELAAGTAYYVSVHANVDAAAQGSAGVTCSTLLAPPDGLACSATTTSIEFSWNEVTGATGYTAKVQLAVAGSDQTEQTTTGVSSTSVTFSELAAGTAYYVSVHANVDAAAQGSAGVTCSTLLAPPDGLACSATTTSIEFSWNEVTGATGYTAKVQLAVAGSDQTEQTTTATSVTFSGLAADTAYYLSVHANVDGEPQGSAGATCTTLPPFGAPVVSCSATADSITVSWGEVEGATRYQVLLGGKRAVVVGTEFTFGGLGASTSYEVEVQAGDGSHWGETAVETCATAGGVGLALDCVVGTSTVVAVWGELEDTSRHRVRRSVGPGVGDWTAWDEIDGAVAVFGGLAYSTAYTVEVQKEVEVQAGGAMGWSAGVARVCETVEPLALPDSCVVPDGLTFCVAKNELMNVPESGAGDAPGGGIGTKGFYSPPMMRIYSDRDRLKMDHEGNLVMVSKGDRGGWVADSDSLADDAWVADSAWVAGNAVVGGNAFVYGSAGVFGNATVEGNALVYDQALVYGRATVTGSVYGDARVFGEEAVVSGDTETYSPHPYLLELIGYPLQLASPQLPLNLDERAKVYGNAWVSGKAKVYDKAEVCGGAVVSGEEVEVYDDAKVCSKEKPGRGPWVSQKAKVYRKAKVYHRATVTGQAKVHGDEAWVYNDATVSGTAEVRHHAKVYDDAWVSSNAVVERDAQVYDDARVGSNTLVTSSAEVYDDAKVFSDGRTLNALAEDSDEDDFLASYYGVVIAGAALVYDDAIVKDGAVVEGTYFPEDRDDRTSVYGNARVSEQAKVVAFAPRDRNTVYPYSPRVYGDAKISGNATVTENARVFGKAEVYGTATVTGHAKVFGSAKIFGEETKIHGNAQVFDAAEVYGNAEVYGQAMVFDFSNSQYWIGEDANGNSLKRDVFEEDDPARVLWTNSLVLVPYEYTPDDEITWTWSWPLSLVEEALDDLLDTVDPQFQDDWDDDFSIADYRPTAVFGDAVVQGQAKVWGGSYVFGGKVYQSGRISAHTNMNSGEVCEDLWIHSNTAYAVPHKCAGSGGFPWNSLACFAAPAVLSGAIGFTSAIGFTIGFTIGAACFAYEAYEVATAYSKAPGRA